MAALASYTLKQDIVLVTRDKDGAETEEVLLAAGSELKLRRPKGKDLTIFDDHPPIAGMLAMISRVTGLDTIATHNLDGEDVDALGNLLGRFLPSAQPTGATA